MLLTIAILAGIGYIFSLISHIANEELDVNIIMATILVLSTWDSCFPLAIIVIILTIIIGLSKFINSN